MWLVPALAVAVVPHASIVPTALRCENLTEPVGIDVKVPRLSWKLKAVNPKAHNLRQIGYRILVASNPVALKAGKGEVWDSGFIRSSNTYGVEVHGKRLTTGSDYYWTVQATDQNGARSAWSHPARFRMGLLSKRDFKGQWIGYDPLAKLALTLDSAKWIWSKVDDLAKAPAGTLNFRKQFVVADPRSVVGASLVVTADDRFVAKLNGFEVGRTKGETDAWKTLQQVDLAPRLHAGLNTLDIAVTNTSEGYAGLLARVVIQTKDGIALDIPTSSSWEVSPNAGEPSTHATVVAKFGDGPWGKVNPYSVPPASYFRRDFTVSRPIKRATAYCSALGLIELHLNGGPVSRDLFTPGWTNYDKRVLYRAYDVTSTLRRGKNAIGAILGDGWYSGYVGFGAARAHYGQRPRAWAQLDIEYTDGGHETIATDGSWKAGTGPITAQDFLAGESYDARKDQTLWDSPGFNGYDWTHAKVDRSKKVNLEAFPSNPVQPYEVQKPVAVHKIKSGAYILNYGQNRTGFARIAMKGRPGQTITLRFSERLDKDGSLYTINLRSAKATDHYTFRGIGVEHWEPKFTFHGFQYIEVTGLDRQPRPDEITAVAISCATPETGSVRTSDAMINRLVSNAWWTQKMNFIDIPSDCPQRDERLGWTGDAQAYIRTACMYSDVQPFFTKWLVSLDDDRSADGNYPMVAPLKVADPDGGPAWADAGVICPSTIYDVYGDRRLLAEHYPAMKGFVDFTIKRSTKDLLPKDFRCFGDWLSINADTPNDVIYEAYFAGSSRLVAQAARTLGKTKDADYYDGIYRKVKASFQKAFVTSDGHVKGDTQCSYVLALAFDLVDGTTKKNVANRLVADIQKRGGRLSTGFVGTRDLMHVLSKIGRNDIAFELLHSRKFPSWGFEIANGATTIWERWDGWTPEKGFQDPGMNSFAHYAYGAVSSWIFAQIGGIQNTAPGFDRVRIAPVIDPHLDWAKTSYDSNHGLIKTSWKRKGPMLSLEVEVPPNVVADIEVPTTDPRSIRSFNDLDQKSPRTNIFRVGSGTYRFESKVRSSH